MYLFKILTFKGKKSIFYILSEKKLFLVGDFIPQLKKYVCLTMETIF